MQMDTMGHENERLDERLAAETIRAIAENLREMLKPEELAELLRLLTAEAS